MKQVYIHGRYPGGNGKLKEVFKILGYDKAISASECKTTKIITTEIIK